MALREGKLTSGSIFLSLRRSAYFLEIGAELLELVSNVVDLGTEAAVVVVLIERASFEAGAVRRGPAMFGAMGVTKEGASCITSR